MFGGLRVVAKETSRHLCPKLSFLPQLHIVVKIFRFGFLIFRLLAKFSFLFLCNLSVYFCASCKVAFS